ncbi:prefoldin subunit alpha [archaeon]|jgi:prefoldin alpha subunit|nr:prefoldin subunit alpha [archaeon]MBT3450921.1 prefoldin subunit alpha [archaeon]MBT6869567.1 prefoldin subunit alpha [archaeon]MBT7193441.1 prefoldin subunit alpha [archaeon]MBT7381032.1 prefoldin subunit alpha [archaeon]
MVSEDKQAEIMEIQQMQQQIEVLSNQVEELKQHLVEIDISKSALLEIQKTKIDTEILAQVSNGIFVKAKLMNNENVIINVGMNTTVEKPIPGAIKLLEEQEGKITQSVEEIEKLLETVGYQAMDKINFLENQEL